MQSSDTCFWVFECPWSIWVRDPWSTLIKFKTSTILSGLNTTLLIKVNCHDILIFFENIMLTNKVNQRIVWDGRGPNCVSWFSNVKRWQTSFLFSNRVNTTDRLELLRQEIRKLNLDAFIVPSEDAHQVCIKVILTYYCRVQDCHLVVEKNYKRLNLVKSQKCTS